MIPTIQAALTALEAVKQTRYLVTIETRSLVHITVNAENDQQAINAALNGEGEAEHSAPADPAVIAVKALESA